MELIQPSMQYKNSFLEALREYQQEGRYIELNKNELQTKFEEYVTKLNNHAHGIDLPEGYVPETIFWLVDHTKFIGRVSIRHRLTEHLMKEGGHIGYDIRPSERRQGYGKMILELVLPHAKQLKLHKVLITCDATNIGSRKIIEFNGGKLENKVSVGNGKPDKLRYWIQL